MSNKRRNRRVRKGTRSSVFGKAFAETKLAANVTEEADWYLDTPDVRLTRIFSVVLLLHVVAVAGILAFKMVDKASDDGAMQLTAARPRPAEAVQQEAVFAANAPQAQTEVAAPAVPTTPAPSPVTSPAVTQGNPDTQYKVQAGDTLVEIASELGIGAEILRQVNDIRSDNELYPGRWLDLPSEDDVLEAEAVAMERPVEAPAPAAVPNTAATQAASTYQVRSGDTAWGISRKFNINIKRLLSHNNIAKPEALQIGQHLTIPSGN